MAVIITSDRKLHNTCVLGKGHAYVYYAYLGDLRLMLIRDVYYLVQIIFVAAIAASIKASGDKNVLTPIKLLESGAHVISINQEERNGT